MTTMATATAAPDTLAEVWEHLRDIHPNRVRFRPAPGTATEEDVVALHDREGRLYELADGVLCGESSGIWCIAPGLRTD